MLIDLSLIFTLIVVAHLLRTSMRWVGRFMIPTPIIAGLLGLIGGPQVFDILPFRTFARGDEQILQISQYPGQLIVLVFATLMLGHRQARSRQVFRSQDVKNMFCYSLAAELGQYGLALLCGIFLLPLLFPAIPSLFAVMLPAGFAGGHGTATIFGEGFANQSWADAMSVGFAFATIGLGLSIVGGVLLINIASRCEWGSFGGTKHSALEQQASSFLPEAEQSSLGSGTVNPIALDPLCWHIAIVFCVYGMTLAVEKFAHQVLPGNVWIPLFALAMLIGAALQFCLDRVSLGQYIDRPTIQRIGSLCADLLVTCGVASIKLGVVWHYAGPILFMSVFGCLCSLVFFFLGSWVFGKQWFERALFTFGWSTGVVGFGVALLRVVDPGYRSRTLEDYGTSYLVIGPVEMMAYPLIIWACTAGFTTPMALALTLIAIVLLLATRVSDPNPSCVAIASPSDIKAVRSK